MALREVIPVCLSYAFVHPMEGDAEAMREVGEVLFNIHNPPLVVVNRVKADIQCPVVLCASHLP